MGVRSCSFHRLLPLKATSQLSVLEVDRTWLGCLNGTVLTLLSQRPGMGLRGLWARDSMLSSGYPQICQGQAVLKLMLLPPDPCLYQEESLALPWLLPMGTFPTLSQQAH